MDFTAYFFSDRLLPPMVLPTTWVPLSFREPMPSEAEVCLKYVMQYCLLRSDTVEEAGDYCEYDIRKP